MAEEGKRENSLCSNGKSIYRKKKMNAAHLEKKRGERKVVIGKTFSVRGRRGILYACK